MSNAKRHADDAVQCLYKAGQFIEATKHLGGPNWGPLDLDTRIMHAATARAYAEMALSEAHHAAVESGENRPTELQVRASSISDACIKLIRQLAHDINRGALKPTGK